MNRREFVKICGLLGIGLPLQAQLTNKEPQSGQKVLIIGAGAGGLTAGYLLKQKGIDFRILEASSNYGGRMKRDTDFADFPIPLGAEWLHVKRDIFEEVVNDENIDINVKTMPYDQDVDKGWYEGEEVTPRQVGFTIDQKFIGSTWFDFFEEYVVPSVKDNIMYNKIVQTVDYTGEEIIVSTNEEEFVADRVIIAVPVKMLQQEKIIFIPSLPKKKAKAIQEVTVWDGCKAFIEFSERFYKTFTGFDITPETDGQKLYYDAAYGQETTKHILGLFAVGTGAQPYLELSDDELIKKMLAELDEIYEGKASATYVKHMFQNWNKEPFIGGAYIYDHEKTGRVRALGKSVDDRLFFAGCAYTRGFDWSSVHTAARSAIRAIDELIWTLD